MERRGVAVSGPPEDAELMARARDGEVDLLSELFERHHRRLFSFFVRLTSDRSASEDLVQEVFVRMLKYRSTYRDDGDFTAWMFTLARNAATDLWRSRPREEAIDPEAPEPASAEPLPSTAFERKDAEARLSRALARLPREKRELLLLARFGEMKYEAIARLLDTSAGAVKLRVHRAMKQLRAAYAAEIAEVRP